MRRILIYRTELLPASETFIAVQTAALKRYSPFFAGLRRDPHGPALDPLQVRSLTTENRLRDKLLRCAYLRSGVAPGFHRSLRDIRPALIHAHFAVDACVALTLKQQLKVPLIVTLHGYDVMRSDEALRRTILGRIYLERRTAMLRSTSLFLCISEHLRQHAIARGFPAEKLAVLRIGIELPEIAAPKIETEIETGREPIVLFVGRMVEKKGCIHLLRAMEHVEAALPEAKLILLGDGPLRAALGREAKSRLRNAVFLGMRPPAEVRRWMQRAGILAAPSIVASDGDAEGLPIVLCEAQAAGLPIVAFHGQGIQEAVVADETALLVPPGDEHALAEAILRLLTDAALRNQLAAAGRKRAAQLFDIRRQTALLEEKYDEVISNATWSGR